MSSLHLVRVLPLPRGDLCEYPISVRVVPLPFVGTFLRPITGISFSLECPANIGSLYFRSGLAWYKQRLTCTNRTLMRYFAASSPSEMGFPFQGFSVRSDIIRSFSISPS
jgi:hypothetical protein